MRRLWKIAVCTAILWWAAAMGGSGIDYAGEAATGSLDFAFTSREAHASKNSAEYTTVWTTETREIRSSGTDLPWAVFDEQTDLSWASAGEADKPQSVSGEQTDISRASDGEVTFISRASADEQTDHLRTVPDEQTEQPRAVPVKRMEKAPASADEQTDKQKAAAEKTVYLTFDDGPGKHTPEVLELLRKAGVRATFFMLGEYVDRYPGLARKVAQSGHAIGNHTYDHVYKELYGSFDEFAKQVTRTDDSIYKATGIRTPLVRAPGGTYGNFDAGYFEAIEEAGYIVHDWNVDSGDSKAEDVKAKDIVATIKGSKLADKLVVLLHDGGNHSETVKALPAVISYYKNKGYRFAVLTEDTEPVRFSLAKKLKWTRPAVTGRQKEFLVREAADRGHGQAAEADRAAAGAMESGGEAGAAAGTGGTGTAGDPQQSGGGNGSAGGEGAAQGQRAAQGTGGDGSVGAVHSGGEAGAAAGTGGGPAQGGANGTTGGKGTEAAASDPRLVLHFEGKAADFEAGQYRLAAGVLQAPLEGLMKAVGGSAAYDPESGVYKAGLGGIVRTWEPQSEESRDGLMVPIRTLFAEFGIRIYRLTMTADVREIWAEYAKR